MNLLYIIYYYLYNYKIISHGKNYSIFYKYFRNYFQLYLLRANK